MVGIYKITSPTGKIYIGQSINIENRKSHYKNYDCKTQSHKDKISLTKTGKPNINKRVPVLQYDLKGNFIKEWESQKQAALSLNINYQGINNCMLGKTKSSNGFIWKKK